VLAGSRGVTARFVDQATGESRQCRRIQSVPESSPQRLGHQQVAFAVDPPHRSTRIGERGGTVLPDAQVIECGEHIGHTVELAGDRAGARVDLAAGLVHLTLELPVPLGPAGVGLAIRAGVARMTLHPRPKVANLFLAPLACRLRSEELAAILLLEIAEFASDA
jgi:hypothetical protein